jgi:hypothetical protein
MKKVSRWRWARRVLFAPLCLVSPVFAARCLWHWRPSVWTAGVFAASIAWWSVVQISRRPEDVLSLALATLGATLNMAVILRNKGRMPVVGMKTQGRNSVWVRANKRHRWLVLADQWKWAGFSIGDAVLITALLWMWIF